MPSFLQKLAYLLRFSLETSTANLRFAYLLRKRFAAQSRFQQLSNLKIWSLLKNKVQKRRALAERQCADRGNKVDINIEIVYDKIGYSKRPVSFSVDYKIDGKHFAKYFAIN